MADIIDQANDVAANFVENSIREHKNATSNYKYPYVEGEADFHCHECNEVIPPLRRKLTSSEYCIECKEYLDNKK